ncbi:MAG TPA: MFS transporter [Kofleriaceae bacterium]|jgi:PAT family beta-lactamase induction signal transducer AmpG|nr:MFS transporter [Kofleriaceae bacterium]
MSGTRGRRLGFLVVVGLASGVPNRLVGDTLTSWLTLAGVDVKTIGLFALVSLPYNVKFVWAPLLDRFRPARLGRRRGWIVLFGIACAAALVALGGMDPSVAPARVALVALGVALLSASLDVAVDAYRTDLLVPAERGPGAAAYVAGYRAAMVATGAGALALSAVVPWTSVYVLFAVLLAGAALLSALAPEPDDPGRPPATLRAAVWDPIRDLARRPGAGALLAFVLLYRIGEGVLATLFPNFLLGDYSRLQVAVLQQGFGMAATVVGAIIGGALLARVGTGRALLWFGGVSAATNLLYAWMATRDPSLPFLAAALTVDNVANGLAVAAFVAFLMSQCQATFSATQYAFLSALSSVAGRLLTPFAANLAHWSWPVFFAATAAAGLPSLLLLRWAADAHPVLAPPEKSGT